MFRNLLIRFFIVSLFLSTIQSCGVFEKGAWAPLPLKNEDKKEKKSEDEKEENKEENESG